MSASAIEWVFLWHREGRYIRLWMHTQHLLVDAFSVDFGLVVVLAESKTNTEYHQPHPGWITGFCADLEGKRQSRTSEV